MHTEFLDSKNLLLKALLGESRIFSPKGVDISTKIRYFNKSLASDAPIV
ncbi:hypothetical protein [Tolypothrix sp. NIES-4075]|nr:hypothetical protein [Tolypothrix sp. NIES-4075]